MPSYMDKVWFEYVADEAEMLTASVKWLLRRCPTDQESWRPKFKFRMNFLFFQVTLNELGSKIIAAQTSWEPYLRPGLELAVSIIERHCRCSINSEPLLATSKAIVIVLVNSASFKRNQVLKYSSSS